MAADVLDRVEAPTPPPPAPPARRDGLAAWWALHRASLAWASPVFLLAAFVQAVNMTGIPQRFDDEGTYVAQAFAAESLGSLTHYTYIYDHPPLGWLQMAGWFRLTGALSRYDGAVMAGREFVLVATLVSAVLLWMLARRLGLSRPAAAGAIALFALSPLAVQFHRSVYLDNVATPWLLVAFLLALAPRRQLLAFAASGAAFAVAVLSKETVLLFLPFLAWSMWRNAHPSTRRYSLSVAAAVLTLVGGSYVLLAVVKGELLPESDRSSLWSGVFFQLAGRDGSGSVFSADSLARVTVDQWWSLDPVFLVAAPVAALLCLRRPRLRPVAGALLFLVAFMLRPGYLPVPYVIALLPFGALVVAAAVDDAVRRARRTAERPRRVRRLVVAVLVPLAVAGVAAPLWTTQLRGLLLADLDRPVADATAWVEQNVPEDSRLVVDDAMWVDLVRAGFERDDVVWYYKVDTDPAVAALAPDGWSDYDYVVTTNSMRTFPDGFPVVAEAIDNSTQVASFGTGDQEVQVLRVDPAGASATAQAEQEQQAARVTAGTQLAGNPDLQFAPATADLVTGGRVDGRVMTSLSAAAGELGPITVADAPLLPGEDDATVARRQLLLTAVDGAELTGDAGAARGLAALLLDQGGTFAAASARTTDAGLLVTWALPTGGGVLPVSTP